MQPAVSVLRHRWRWIDSVYKSSFYAAALKKKNKSSDTFSESLIVIECKKSKCQMIEIALIRFKLVHFRA